MLQEMKFSSTAVAFGSCADRYVLGGYSPQKSFEEMLEAAKKVPHLEGIELIGGWQLTEANAQQVVKKVVDSGLKVSMIIPELWSSAKWGRGSFAANDQKVRQDAIANVKKSMELAQESGCNLISPWFGQDGYDYCFQADYIKSWDRIVEGLINCADYLPEVKIAVEYKIKEPRTHCFIGSIGKAILLVKEVDRVNVGINLDIGHALEGYENMAESVALLKRFDNKLFHLHLNDNYRLWDDDMIPGSVHTIENLELLYWLNKIGYDGWYSLDVFPYREDGLRAVIEGIEWFKGLFRVLNRIGMDNIEKVIREGDATKSLALIRKGLLA